MLAVTRLSKSSLWWTFGICLPISFYGWLASIELFHAEGFNLVLVYIVYAPAMLVYVLYALAGRGLVEGIWVEFVLLAVALFAQIVGYFVIIRTVRLLYRRIQKQAA